MTQSQVHTQVVLHPRFFCVLQVNTPSRTPRHPIQVVGQLLILVPGNGRDPLARVHVDPIDILGFGFIPLLPIGVAQGGLGDGAADGAQGVALSIDKLFGEKRGIYGLMGVLFGEKRG